MATRRNTGPGTALSRDYGYTAVDDYDIRTYLLPALRDREQRAALIAEHRAAPRGAATQPGTAPCSPSPTLKRLIDRLRVVPQAGKHTIVVIEHDMTFVRQISQGRTVTFLHQGHVLCEGPVDKVQNDERVIEVYLGRKSKAA